MSQLRRNNLHKFSSGFGFIFRDCSTGLYIRVQRQKAEWRGDESDLIPEGLKPLRTARRDGDCHFVNHLGSCVREGSVGRLTPVIGRENAAMGEGDFDEEPTDGQCMRLRMGMRMYILYHQL
ncbi:hypothetical protein QQ045_012190 [Rhodiola kirilowii]